MNEKMFCYQCQETAGCKGCTMVGVCGKQPDVAAMQDLLVYVSKGLSAVTTALRREGQTIPAGINHLITLNLFTTITNANFDRESIEARIRATLEARQEQLARLNRRDGLPEAALWDGSGDWEEKARTVGVLSTRDEDIRSLRELITYGLKGLSAYSKHANVLLQDDPEVDAFLQRALAATLDDSLTVQDLVNLTLETGKYGVAGMALLDKANTEAYGNPEITVCRWACAAIRASLCRGMTCATSRCCSNRPRAPAWMSTPIPRCCPPTIIRPSRNTRTLWATTATPGGNRRRSSRPSTARSS